MGWDAKPCPKPSTARALAALALQEFLNGWGTNPPRVLHHKAGNGVLYAKMESTLADGTKKLWIAVVLYEWSDGELWLKYMDNSVGPCYYNCPVSWLKDVPIAGEHDRVWRAKILERQNTLKASRNITAGDRVRFDAKYGDTDLWVYSGTPGVFRSTTTGAYSRLRNWRQHFLCVEMPGKEVTHA